MIRHVIIWKLAETDETRRAEIAQEFATRLRALPAAIPEILSFEVGVNEAFEDTNWHVTLVSEFASLETLAAYGAHPVHQEFSQWVKPRVAQRAAVDYTV